MNLPPSQQPTLQTEVQGSHQPASGNFGKFELLNSGCEGGMGVVYRARQIALDRIVALKMIRGVFATPVQLARFRAEAEAAASLDHPNIVPIYEVGEHAGQQYFAMKWIEGHSLADTINESPSKNAPAAKTAPRETQKAAAQIMSKIARAVHHAHQRGIIHRDLKPANVLLDAQGEPHVTDFGIARRLEGSAEITAAGAILGTPGYMSPEQAQGKAKELTVVSDVFSLGAILYCMLAGRAPFVGESPFEIIAQVIEKEPPRLSAFNPSLDRDLETICLKCLQKAPQRRYPSAAELADDLENWLSGRPITARPVTEWERAWKWLKRHSLLSSLTAAIALSLVLGLCGVTWQWKRAEKQRSLTASANRRLSLQLAEDLFIADKSHLALATLARSLRENSTNRAAAERLINALDQRVLFIPASPGKQELGPRTLTQHETLVLSVNTPESFQISNTLSKAILISVPHAHSGPMRCIQFSPDGSHIVTASADFSAKIWNARTGALLFDLKHRHPVNWAEFSPEGSRVVTATEWPDSSARIWNASTGLPLEGASPMRHLNSVNTARFAPLTAGRSERELILTSSDDRTARVWDGRSGEAMSEAVHASSPVDDARFSSDSSSVTLLLEHDAAQTYKLTAGIRLLPASAAEVPSPASAIEESGELNSLKERLRPKHSGEITKIALSPMGNILATGSTDKFARLWDARTLELRAELSHDVTVNCVAFSPDGARLATSTAIPTRVRVWDVQTAQPLSEWIFVNKPVAAVAFSADGLFVISSSGWRWRLHPISGKTPEWLPTLAEAVAGVRYSSGGILETVAPNAFESARRLISNAAGTDALKEWARELIGNDVTKAK